MSKQPAADAARGTKPGLSQVTGSVLQRQCACGSHTLAGASCAQCSGTQQLQRRAADASHVSSGLAPIIHDVLRSPGQPLDAGTRAFFEPRLSHDLSKVRIHINGKAAESARAVRALAYTVGQDIVFNAARYQPRSKEGRKVLAHELIHVAQQARGPVTGVPMGGGLTISHPDDPFERQAEEISKRILMSESSSPNASPPSPTTHATSKSIQRQMSETDEETESASVTPPVTWASGPVFGSPFELSLEEAARRVNAALDIIGPGLTYVRRPPLPPEMVAFSESPSQGSTLQTFPDFTLQRAPEASSGLAKVHGGVVGSIQLCWDCLTGEGSLKGWIWAGIGYEAPIIGWVGGYFFGERTWWKGELGRLFEPGQCATNCDRSKGANSESGWGIAGFPVDIKPRQRMRFSKAGAEVGALLTPHSFCDADLEFIVLLNILSYLGPVASVSTKAIDGLNALTRGTPHFELQAGIDASATFHLCRGASSLLTVNRADFCGGGYVGAGVGLSHSKNDNHGAI
jgi:hypothetical protein